MFWDVVPQTLGGAFPLFMCVGDVTPTFPAEATVAWFAWGRTCYSVCGLKTEGPAGTHTTKSDPENDVLKSSRSALSCSVSGVSRQISFEPVVWYDGLYPGPTSGVFDLCQDIQVSCSSATCPSLVLLGKSCSALLWIHG